jgi:hypothetical protein
MSRRLVVVVMTVGVLLLTAGGASAGDSCPRDRPDCSGVPAPETTGDQDRGSVVTDGATFPDGKPDGDLSSAVSENKGCKDCHWAIVPACDGGPVDGGLCAGALVGCPDPGNIRYRVYLRHGTGPWILRGAVCLGPEDRPPPVQDVGRAVRERVVNLLPDAAPSFQPVSGGIVNLATLFASGEPETLTTEPFDVLGFTIVVTARARWDWTFEPGVAETFHAPGGAYPDDSVAHTYAGPGTRRVGLTTYWHARFTVNGEGPFAVPGPEISKTAAPLTVPVREARSELVGG